MTWATPLLPLPVWMPCGQVGVLVAPSFHSPVESGPTDFSKKLVKFCVVPELSARTATTIGLSGSVLPGLSAAILGSFQFVISAWKIPAIVAGESCKSSTPDRLYDKVMGASTVGT